MRKKKYSNKELAEACIFPHGLSKEEKEEADKELLAFRMEIWNKRSSQDKIRDKLLQMKYQLEFFINEQQR